MILQTEERIVMEGKTYERTERRKEKLMNVLKKRQPELTIILENINDPHNMSACLRSCDAVGIMKVYMIYHSGQPFPKLGAQSSASAKKWVEYERFDTVEECFTKLRNDGYKIYTTHMGEDSVSLYSLELTGKVALMFGNEHSGVSAEAYENADGNFLIPQHGMIQSLNISVACAVSLFEAQRQRQVAGKYDIPQLSSTELDSKYSEWLKK